MRKFSKTLVSMGLAIGLGSAVLAPANAAVVVDPSIGGEYQFGWTDGLGRIDWIGETHETEWSVEVAVDSYITISAWDAFVPGDEFGLIFNDVSTAWDVVETVEGYFQATASLFLSAGVNTFSLDVTALAHDLRAPPGVPARGIGRRMARMPGASRSLGYLTSGAGYISFSAVDQDVPVVPLPAALPMLASAMGLFGYMRHRKKRKQAA